MKKFIISLFLLISIFIPSMIYADDMNNETGTDSSVLPTESIALDSLSQNDLDLITDDGAFTPITVSVKTVSEYDMIKDLQSCSYSALESEGYTQEEISKIKAPLKAKSSYGNVTYTISYDKMYQKGGQTYLHTRMTWNWSKAPICQFTDIPAMTTSESFTMDSAKSKVQYYSYGNKKIKSTLSHPTVKTKSSGRGVFIRVDMGKNYDSYNHKNKNIALSGSISSSWSTGKKLKQVGISSNYGHATASCSVSVSFGKGISISFSPSNNCKRGDEAYAKATLSK